MNETQVPEIIYYFFVNVILNLRNFTIQNRHEILHSHLKLLFNSVIVRQSQRNHFICNFIKQILHSQNIYVKFVKNVQWDKIQKNTKFRQSENSGGDPFQCSDVLSTNPR